MKSVAVFALLLVGTLVAADPITDAVSCGEIDKVLATLQVPLSTLDDGLKAIREYIFVVQVR